MSRAREDDIGQGENVILTQTFKKLLPKRTGSMESLDQSMFDLELSSKDVREPAEEKPSDEIFQSLSEEGERYLRENMMLPPIGDLPLTKFYVNLHPTESVMSSSVNSVDSWWNRLDYDDMGDSQGQAAEMDQHRPSPQTDGRTQPRVKSFPRTKEVLLERRLEEKIRQEQCQAQVISNLEKQMVSLYHLKRQYKRNTAREGCRGDPLSLPPLVVPDKLNRQRDSLLNRIKRKKAEEEKKRQKQIDRRLEIVKKLLDEQRRKEFRSEHKLEKCDQRKEITVEAGTLLEDNKTTVVEHEDDNRGSDQQFAPDAPSVDHIPMFPDSDPHSRLQPPAAPEELIVTKSPRTASGKKQKDKQKRNVNQSDNTIGKKKKKISDAPVETAATCEQQPELPASHMPELLLWFEQWREQKAAHERHNEESGNLPLESRVVLSQSKVTFKNARPGYVATKQVTVTNVGESLLKCQVAEVVFEKIGRVSPILKVALEGPAKARTGNCWTLLVTLETLDAVEDTMAEVRLVFCREDSARTRLSVVVEVLTPRAKPALSTSCIRFAPQVFWSKKVVTKHLEITNPGSLGCEVRWLRASACVGDTKETDAPTELGPSFDQTSDATQVCEEMVEVAFEHVFDVFRINAWQPIWVPPKSQVSLLVNFVPAIAPGSGDVYSKYRFTFEGKRVENSSQDLLVCGKIEDSGCHVDPLLLDLGVCYLGGSVQQDQFRLISSARAVTSVSARVPRALAPHVAVVPPHILVQAHSSVTMTVRVVLSWNFSKQPCEFLDSETGLLSFPVLLAVGPPPCPPLELPVVALVAPPCPLTLAPPLLDLGQVSTRETVSTPVTLTNHSLSCPFRYAFVDLPQGVMIEPGGGHGTILPGETLFLDLMYYPTAKDVGVSCQRPGSEGAVNFTVRCFTSTSLAAPVLRKKKPQYGLPNRNSIIEEVKISHANEVASLQSSGAEEGETSSLSEFASGSVNVEDNLDDCLTRATNAEIEVTEVGLDEEEQNVNSTNIVSTFENVSNQSLVSDTEQQWDYYSSFLIKEQDTVGVGEKDILKSHSGSLLIEGDEKRQDSLMQDATRSIKHGKNIKVEHEIPKIINKITNIHNFDEVLLADKNYTENIFMADNGVSPILTQTNEIAEHIEEVHTDKAENLRLLPDPCQRFTSISVRAHVVDPLVELSSQAILLPATPCNSSSMAHIYIRSRPQERCNVHNKRTNFRTWFQFRSSYEYLSVKPESGCLRYKESEKITLIFKPNLRQEEIFAKALEMKIESMKWNRIQDMLEQYYLAKTKQKLKKSQNENIKVNQNGKDKELVETIGNKREKSTKTGSVKTKGKTKGRGSVVSSKANKTQINSKTNKLKKKESMPLPLVTIDPGDVELSQDDLRNAESWLLKYTEPQTMSATLSCLLETELDNGVRRLETLGCEVVCRVEAPVIVLSSPACLDFGPRALGSSSRICAEVTNVSFFYAFVRISTLSPVGQFMCPAALETPLKVGGGGLQLPPEHILRIPILYRPTVCSKVIESFEVISGSTVLHVQAKGEGVPPSFSLTPDREIFFLSSAEGKKAEVVVTIENTCLAPLSFQIKKIYLKEGVLPVVGKSSAPQSSDKRAVQKGKPKKERKAEAEPHMLTPELVNCLGDFIDVQESNLTEPVFHMLGIEETFNISVGETKKVTVRFTPLVSTKPETEQHDVKPKEGTTNKSKQDQNRPNTKKKTKKKSVTIDKVEITDAASVKKKGEVMIEDRHISEKSNEKEKKSPSKTQIAVKYEILLFGTEKVKDWVFIGSVKK